MEIKGKVFDVYTNSSGWIETKLILKKSVFGKMTPIAFKVFGKAKEMALTLKRNDRIRGTVLLTSKFIKGNYYTDVSMYNIEKIETLRKNSVWKHLNKGGFLFTNE